jgi:Fic-DOC domain mobile mystery protein B
MAFGTTIPGETPIDDVSGLLIKDISLRRELNEAETNNIADAILKYLVGIADVDDAPFDFSWALQLHREMFGKVWAWAGKLRKVELNIGVPAMHVEPRLYELLCNLRYWHAMPLIEQAARLHHGAVAIHPFLNGNGRWSRMLANIWLKQHGTKPTEWPEQAVGEVSVIRQEYLTAIKAADLHDLAPLIGLHMRFTPASVG